MPLALSDVDNEIGYTLGTGEVPFTIENAALAFTVINHWAQIDAKLGSIIVALMSAEPEPALAMFSAVASSEAKKSMVYAAADNALSPDAAALIRATVESCNASRKERNSIAHDVWGRLHLPDSPTICVAAKDFSAFEARMNSKGATDRPLERFQIDRSKIMVWSASDFRNAATRALESHGKIARLPFIVRGTGYQMRDKLLADPQIARLHANRLAKNRMT